MGHFKTISGGPPELVWAEAWGGRRGGGVGLGLGWAQAPAASYLRDPGDVASPVGRTHLDLLWEQESTGAIWRNLFILFKNIQVPTVQRPGKKR